MPEAQQTVADDGPGDLGFHHIGIAGLQDEQRENQLRRISERHVQQAADRRPHSMRGLLRRAAHPLGQRNDRDHRSDEDVQRRRMYDILEQHRNRCQRQ